MYPTLKKEMRSHGVTLSQIARDPRINKTVSTISLKLSGRYNLTYAEAITIKEIIGSDLPLEKLFDRAEP